MKNLIETIKNHFYLEHEKALKLIFIGVILLIIVGVSGTLNFLWTDTYIITLFGTILFAIIMGAGILLFLYKYLQKIFFKPPIGKLKKSVACVFAIILTLNALLGILMTYYYVRIPPSFETDERLQLETWTAVPPAGLPPCNGLEKHHKSNTKLYYWKGYFYLAYQNSKWHLEDKNGEIVIARSKDASEGSWERVAAIKGPGKNDVRDPLLTEIKGQLFLYFLPNYRFDPGPNETYYCISKNGITWSEPEKIYVDVNYDTGIKREEGWMFGRQRPLTKDNKIWYCMASGRRGGHYMTILIRSRDGINWKEVSVVYDTYPSGEPCFEFLPDGEIICTLRVGQMSSWRGYEFGTPHAGTIIARSYNNLKDWSYSPEFQTRMDGATIFKVNGRYFVAGRNHLGPRIDTGNHVAKKRTAVYELLEDRLVWLFDLPSNGDTAYTGVVILGDEIYISYYTNLVNHDLPWIIGLAFYSATEIHMARFSASGLEEYANEVRGLNV
ncbi:MAG: sialidase family protein [Promethearchaeota archaeon]